MQLAAVMVMNLVGTLVESMALRLVPLLDCVWAGTKAPAWLMGPVSSAPPSVPPLAALSDLLSAPLLVFVLVFVWACRSAVLSASLSEHVSGSSSGHEWAQCSGAPSDCVWAGAMARALSMEQVLLAALWVYRSAHSMVQHSAALSARQLARKLVHQWVSQLAGTSATPRVVPCSTLQGTFAGA